MADEEITTIPRVLGVNLGISFFGESQDPVLVMNAIISAEFMDIQLAHHAGIDEQCVVPLAFAAEHLKGLIGQIVEGVIRANTIQEMTTTWPEKRDEIIENLLFRWTATLDTGQDGGDGEPQA